jgi:hypothetical protein
MIPKTGDVTAFDKSNINTLKQILDTICAEAERTVYMDTIPVAKDVAIGTRVIYDDGLGDMRIYWKTGKGNLGYITLT